jgi:hypothetical protein
MSRWVAIPAAVACLVAAALFVPFLARGRTLIASTPSPRPLFSVSFAALPPGGRLCASDVTIPHDARVLHVQARTFGRPGPALAVTLSAPGYAARARVAAGYPDETTLAVPFRPPALTTLGRVCVGRAAAAPLALVASGEPRTQSRPRNTVDGRPVGVDAYLAFTTGRTGSAISQTPAIVGRMAAFRPGVVGPWLLWPLLVLTVLGVPAGVAWALRRALP